MPLFMGEKMYEIEIYPNILIIIFHAIHYSQS